MSPVDWEPTVLHEEPTYLRRYRTGMVPCLHNSEKVPYRSSQKEHGNAQ